MGVRLPQMLEIGGVRSCDGVVLGVFAITPAVEDDEGDGFLGVHGRNYTTVLTIF